MMVIIQYDDFICISTLWFVINFAAFIAFSLSRYAFSVSDQHVALLRQVSRSQECGGGGECNKKADILHKKHNRRSRILKEAFITVWREVNEGLQNRG
jgi:hypothetical protein